MFDCKEPIDNDEWWLQARMRVDKAIAESQKAEIDVHLQQGAEKIFARILPILVDYHDTGEDITHYIVAEVAGYANAKNKAVKRLWELWTAHYAQHGATIPRVMRHKVPVRTGPVNITRRSTEQKQEASRGCAGPRTRAVGAADMCT